MMSLTASRRSLLAHRLVAVTICGLALSPVCAKAQISAPIFFIGQTQEKTPPPASSAAGLPIANEAPTNFNAPIQPNYVINITVAGESEPSGDYIVDASGNVSIRYASIATPVMIKGLTPAQAKETIVAFLKTYIKAPDVSVRILSVPRPTVTIRGAVKTQGPLSVPSGTTLIDILTTAAWTENADLTKVIVTHTDYVNGQPKLTRQSIAFDKYISPGRQDIPDESQNIVLHDKDVVFVPFKGLPGNSTVSVLGEVGKPTEGIPVRLNPPMTVRDAISLVGGPTQFANRKKVKINRPNEDRPLIIDLDKANDGDAVQNVELKPGDAIYVERLSENSFINVNGGFMKPGKIVYDKPTTLVQAINEAGGPLPGAKISKGVIWRTNDGKTKVIPFKFNEIAKGKAQDIPLQAGDSIYIEAGLPPQPGQNGLAAISAGAQALNGISSLTYLFR